MMNDIEKWIPINGYEKRYLISNKGMIKSIERSLNGRFGGTYLIGGKIICNHDNGSGYRAISLRNEIGLKTFYIHRLVAMHFIENPLGLPEVNHENGDKNCNEYWNLKWCTRKENEEHAYKIGLKKTGENHWRSKPILQLDLNGDLISRFENARFAFEKFKFHPSIIQRCALGKIKSAYGYLWKYE